MVAGIIVGAAADELVLSHPSATVDAPTAWMVLGGPALFLLGHAAFKATVWRVVPWTRLVAVAVLALLATVATRVNALTLGVAVAVVVVAVAASDRFVAPGHEVSS